MNCNAETGPLTGLGMGACQTADTGWPDDFSGATESQQLAVGFDACDGSIAERITCSSRKQGERSIEQTTAL